MLNRIVFEPDDPRVHTIELPENSARDISVDANMWAVRAGGALSSAVWSVLHGPISVGADTESSNVTTAKLTAGSAGRSLIEVKLTLDGSGGDQVGIQYIRILTREMNLRTTDYHEAT